MHTVSSKLGRLLCLPQPRAQPRGGVACAQAGPTLACSHRAFVGCLAVAAGVITALVANAAMRAARCFELGVRTPQFAEDFVRTSAVATGTLTLCMGLPPLGCLLWVQAPPLLVDCFVLHKS